MQAHVGPSEWALLVLSITSVQTCTHYESSIVYTGNIQRKERIQQFTMIFGNKLTLYFTNYVISVNYTLLAD